MRSRRERAPALSPAVTELLEESGELDQILSGHGLTFEHVPSPSPPPAPEPLRIEPPPWSEHYRGEEGDA